MKTSIHLTLQSVEYHNDRITVCICNVTRAFVNVIEKLSSLIKMCEIIYKKTIRERS